MPIGMLHVIGCTVIECYCILSRIDTLAKLMTRRDELTHSPIRHVRDNGYELHKVVSKKHVF